MKGKFLEQVDQVLDIRKLIQSQLDVTMLKKRLMTTQQRLMFSYQRGRLLQYESGSDSEASGYESPGELAPR